MFSRLVFGKKDEPAVLEVFLDNSLYERFRDYIMKNHLSESDAVVKILERGMANYWLHEFKQTKSSYLHIKKLFEEFKRDNELLKALQVENEQLKSILEKANLKVEE
jgi:cell shape-determining protein MreC